MSALYYHYCIRWIVQCLLACLFFCLFVFVCFWIREMVMMTLPSHRNTVVNTMVFENNPSIYPTFPEYTVNPIHNSLTKKMNCELD